MIYETIRYTEDGRVHLQTYVPELFSIKGNALPAMIVLPGGAWNICLKMNPKQWRLPMSEKDLQALS